MIDIANKKIPNRFWVDNLLDIKHNQKYDIIISFFAVFNHLKNYKQFKTALKNLLNILSNNGTVIIDLHNPQKSGSKTETIENYSRNMSWKKCKILKKEFTKITYTINEKTYKSSHTFKIFNVKKLIKIATKLGFSNIKCFENYNINQPAKKHSKNIQLVLSKKN